MNDLERFYDEYHNDIDEAWCVYSIEQAGYDVTENPNWDEFPPDWFIEDQMQAAKEYAEQQAIDFERGK